MKKMPKYAARRFAGKASLVMERDGHRSALLCATRPFRVWKKVRTLENWRRSKVIALTIPKGAQFWCHYGDRKCRADRAISRGNGQSFRDSNFFYRRNAPVEPDRFFKRERICAPGIHFFATEAGARRFYWT